MSLTAGIDVGSTYTKAVVLDPDRRVLGRAMCPTGFRLESASRQALDEALAEAGAEQGDVSYVTTTGYGRNMVSWRDLQVTDMTAQSWGTRSLFPGTRTVLDV
jgi:activator of 2-hydroxyglutaryl-CoA dehydratase